MGLKGIQQTNTPKSSILLPLLIVILYVAAFIIPWVSITVSIDNQLKTPIITDAYSKSYDSVEIKWTAISHADGYQIFRYDDAAGKFEYIKTVAAGGASSNNILSYTDNNLTHDTGYAYYVRAYKKGFFSKKFSSPSDIASATPELTPSEIVSVKNTDNSNVIIYWEKVDDISGYELYRSEDPYSGYEKIYATENPDTVNYTDRNLKNKKTYHYKIRTFFNVDIGGNNELIISDLSGFESERSIGKNAEDLESKLQEKLESASASVESNDPGFVIDGYKVISAFNVKSYAYSGGGLTATGQKCQVGRIAVDPNIIPLGTWLYVEGYGLCQACDTGGDIIGKTIDVYMNTEYECKRWGVKYPMVYVLSR